jgi:hypothetical protein
MDKEVSTFLWGYGFEDPGDSDLDLPTLWDAVMV